MFETFTYDARRTLVLAQEAARTRRHGFIGTEHLLLGVIAEDQRPGGSRTRPVLPTVGTRSEALTGVVDEVIAEANIESLPDDQELPAQLPFTPRSKRVLELALAEALEQHVRFIGREHILLGIAREGEGLGGQALGRAGITLTTLRETVAARARRGAFDLHYTAAGQAAMAQAWELADNESTDVGTHHLLTALRAGTNSVAAAVFDSLDLSAERLSETLAGISTEGTLDQTKRVRWFELRPEREGIEVWISDSVFQQDANRSQIYDKLRDSIMEAVQRVADDVTAP